MTKMPRTAPSRMLSELIVVFDTSVIKTESAEFVLRKDVVDLIEANKSLDSLAIRWFLPEMVRHERAFQMKATALKLLDAVAKVERIVDKKLGVTPDALTNGVDRTIDDYLARYQLETHRLDTATVDWRRMIAAAAERLAPFENGSKEKGFRDAVILESFDQLLTLYPPDKKGRRCVLACNDGLLKEAALFRINQRDGVTIVSSFEELRDFINELSSTLDEKTIADLSKKAADVFASQEGTGLFFSAPIQQQIRERFVRDLELSSDLLIALQAFSVMKTSFVRKDGDQIHWSSRIDVNVLATREVLITPFSSPFATSFGNAGTYGQGVAPIAINPSLGGDVPGSLDQPRFPSIPKAQPISFLYTPPSASSYLEKQTVFNGLALYDVAWHTSRGAGKLTKPHFDQLTFAGKSQNSFRA